MFGLPLAFAAPAVLAALVGLVALFFLLRVTPPSPRQALFPPLRLLIGLNPTETTPARTPWPILALRLAIDAMSQGGQDIAALDRPGVEGGLRALAPVPYAPNREAALPAIERFLAHEPNTDILWIADG